MTDRALTRGEVTGISVYDVLRAANEMAGVDLAIKSPKRYAARFRFAAFSAARRLTTASYPRIGGVFGGMDHTSVIHGEKRADAVLVDRIVQAVLERTGAPGSRCGQLARTVVSPTERRYPEKSGAASFGGQRPRMSVTCEVNRP